MSIDKTVLIIEDDPDQAELARRAFFKINLSHVYTVCDGAEALGFLSRCNKLPNLILLDLKMPRLGGFELLQEMRDNPRLSPIPVIVFTCSNEEMDIIESYLLGARSFIEKPLTTEKLYKAFAELELTWTGLKIPVEGNQRLKYKSFPEAD